MLLTGVILTCSAQLNGERSNNAIYHLLKGQKSIQTIQDAHLFKLDPFYGIHQSLQYHLFQKKLNELLQNNYLLKSTSFDTYTLSKKGKEWLKINEYKLMLNDFNGLKYYHMDQIFIDRLLLLIQVLTNSRKSNTSYIPVIDKPPIMNWVKSFYVTNHQQISDHLKNVYIELQALLTKVSKVEAEVFVDRLTGYNHYGHSIPQLIDKYKVEQDDLYLLLNRMTHHLLNSINCEKTHFPLMSLILKDLSTYSFITKSARITYRLINKIDSLENIANYRELKLSTIYDHLVEIALYDSTFPIDSYVDKQDQDAILAALNDLNSNKLKNIKKRVHENISYFQIRLTLAFVNTRSR